MSTRPLASPYDYSGHWTGSAQEGRQPGVELTADFTATGAKTFAGTIAAGGDQPALCTATGKAKRHLKVAMRATCDDGGTVKLLGRLNPDTQTITGTLTEKRPRRRHHARFTLRRPTGSAHARILHGPSRSASLTAFSTRGQRFLGVDVGGLAVD